MKNPQNIDCIQIPAFEAALNNRFELRGILELILGNIRAKLGRHLRAIFHPDRRRFEQLFGLIFDIAPD